MKIVLLDRIDLPQAQKEKIKNLDDVTIYEDIPTEQNIIERIREADIITVSWVDITEQIINTTSNLKYIIVAAVGYDWVNVKAASSRGIKVINCPTQNAWAVAEHAIDVCNCP